MLPQGLIDEIIHEAFDRELVPLKFERTQKRTWIRSAKPQIRDLIWVAAWKGYSFSPCWGFSLDFVPHISGSSLKWHRTPKNAAADFVYDPYKHGAARRRWDMKGLDDEAAFRRQTEDAARLTTTEAVPYLNNVTDLPTLYERFVERYASFNEREYLMYPQLRMAYAFLLAAAGKRGESNSCIELCLKQANLRPEVEDAMRSKLSKCLDEMEPFVTKGNSP